MRGSERGLLHCWGDTKQDCGDAIIFTLIMQPNHAIAGSKFTL